MIYHLEVEAKFCKVDGLLNGFPIYSLNGNNPAIFSKPINAGLIGSNNLLSFLITPSEKIDISEIYSIQGSIKKYTSNQMTGPDQGEIVATFSQQNLPVAAVTFDNEIFDFSSLLKENPKIEKEINIIEYAEKLITLLKQTNKGLILSEFDFKLRDYAFAYSVDKEILVNQFFDYLENNYFANDPILDIRREDIYIRPWCDKRIWEIGVGADFTELMLTRPNNDGIEYATKIFVAYINNSIKVVR
jgi:hypothetical protein